jgi:diguanylate cyclase (GGDEF)-like protein
MASTMTVLRSWRNVYLAGLLTLTIALVVVAAGISSFPTGHDALLALLIAGCTTLAITFPVHSGPQQTMTLNGSAIFAAVLLLEPQTAIITVGLGTLLGQFARRAAPVELLFNTLQTMLQTAAGGFVLWLVNWNYEALTVTDWSVVPVLLLAILAIEAVNVVLVAGIITFESDDSFSSSLRVVLPRDIISTAAPYALGLLAAVAINAHLWTLPLLLFLALEVRRSSQRYVQLRQQAVTMEHQALHDALTGLPNRTLFFDRVDQALARTARYSHRVAVLFVDLDRFKVVNDTLGHPAGDQLLLAVAQRLSAATRQQDTVARLGGDEFTVLAENIDDRSDAEGVARRLTDSLREPFAVEGQRVAVSASIGIALNQPGETTTDDLIKHADIALYHAKARGGDAIEFFSSQDTSFSLERMTLEADLWQAVTNGELRVFYQPQVDFLTSRVTAVEALLRWEHPEQGLLPPSAFLPFAEQSGLILPIGQWVLDAACQQAREWRAQWGDRAPTVSVNLSVRQIHETDLLHDVAQVLHESAIPPHALSLEVTEGMMLEGTGETLSTMQRLKELGVRLVIDDFGTGYAGLSYLKRIPADDLKIDQSFVRGLDHDAGDRAIVEAINNLAHNLSMRVVAEGIETGNQLQQLQMIGCDVGQGYYFSRPVPAAQLIPFMLNGYAASLDHSRSKASFLGNGIEGC